MKFCRARAKKILAKPGPELGKIPPTRDPEAGAGTADTPGRPGHAERGVAPVSGGNRGSFSQIFRPLRLFRPIGYFTFNPQGVILEANLTGVRLLELERASLMGTPFLPHVVPVFRPEFKAHLQQVFATQAEQFCTVQLAASEGAAAACRRWKALRSPPRARVPSNACLPSATAPPVNSPKKTCAAVRKNFICSLIRRLLGTSPWTRQGVSLR